MLKEGEKAPEFSLLNQTGQTTKLSDFIGMWVLLYFYPKDDTPGCTSEACALRDNYDNYKKVGIQVIGISADNIDSHQKFINKYRLPFTLLSDPNREVIKKYQAGLGPITKRVSYLIDPNGVISKVYPKVIPSNHAQEVLSDWHLLNKQ